MIQRFRFGLPLPTDSVVQEIPVSAGPVPFLTAEAGLRESRVRLCDLVAQVLRHGLALLGIDTPDRI